MDTNTALGIALIVMQTGWGVAAWKASKATAKRQVEHEKSDADNFGKIKKALGLQVA
jgi:hypothetical protein